jgi:hypothetical protein
MSYKNLTNNSGKELTVTLLTRLGGDPVRSGHPVVVSLKKDERKRVEYGNHENPYLNGVSLAWQDSGSDVSQMQVVATRGSTWDNTLNTNDTLTISAVNHPNITGSNS